MDVITLKDVDKIWGNFQALNHVNFQCKEGQLLALLGPSGCGKSTTLRLIAGLETPTSGTIEIKGKDVTFLPPAKRNISMVFQNYALFPHLTVKENILFGLKARKVPVTERRKRLANAVDLLGLSTLLDRKPAHLSGGQRQRVALGRAIVAQSSICLMDEPLSNLDAKLRQEMRQEIRSLQQRLDMTMIYVTHDQVEAMTMADEIILIKDGNIEQHGTAEDLYNRPETIFAAKFIGSPPMNILSPDANLMKAFSSMLPDGITPESHRIGVRPEDIQISENRGINVEIETIEYLGADTMIGCRFGEQRITMTVKGKNRLHIGDHITLDWKPDHIHLFDAQSGRRLKNI